MLALLWERLLHTVVVLAGLSLAVFLILHAGADVAAELLPPDATPEQVAAFRRQMGFDQPLLVQYARWLGGALRGDFGESWRHRQPAFELVLERLPATIELAMAAQIVAVVVALPLGVLAAVRRNSLWDRAAVTLAVFGQAVPQFWLGLMLILLLSVQLGLLPVSGRGTALHLLMPLFTLAARPLARTARLVRSGVAEVLGEDYVRTARAKGLAERIVLVRHALRNALLPIITVIGLELGSLLNGSVVVESVFAWPGLGRLIVQALQGLDMPLVEASVLLTASMYVVLNLAVDLCYLILDPRVRYG